LIANFNDSAPAKVQTTLLQAIEAVTPHVAHSYELLGLVWAVVVALPEDEPAHTIGAGRQP
jgi:Ni,Fe-hydrogenase I large subunit